MLKKRIVSLLSALALLVSASTYSTYVYPETADAAENNTNTTSDAELMSETYTPPDGVTVTASGSSPVEWTIYSDGVLHITGSGSIPNYSEGYPSSQPGWGNYSYWSLVKKIIIEDGITSIGSYSFQYLYYATEVSIPSSVKSIGTNVFSQCDKITSIKVSEDNPNFCSDENGVLFNKDKTTLVYYPVGKTAKAYTVPNGVTTISNCAFKNNSNLTEVTLPNSVTSIGDYAFNSCFYLTYINMGESVTSIGAYAFASCQALKEITLPETLETINMYAFTNCSQIEKIAIPSGVTMLPMQIFANCTSLTRVTIPTSVKTINSAAFADCTSLKEVCYSGTEEEWQTVSGYNREPLASAQKYYNGSCRRVRHMCRLPLLWQAEIAAQLLTTV